MTVRITLTADNGLLAGTEYAFSEPGTCVIGRAEDCDIRLPGVPGYQDVSRHHCLLDLDPPQLRVRDLGSRNGTRLNGLQIGCPASPWAPREDRPLSFTPSYSLCDGDELQVGGTVFRVSGAVTDASPPEPANGRVGERACGLEPAGGMPHGIRANAAPVETCWPSHLALDATTAADLMTPDVISIPETATLPEAVALLTEKGLGTVPVVGGDGHPVGVLSRTDVVAYDCREYGYPAPAPDAEASRPPRRRTFGLKGAGLPRVRDVMSEVVFSVAPQTPAATVVDAMLSLGVHRLFVTDPDGGVVGVISTTDVLRHLHQPVEPFAAEVVPSA